MKKFFALCALAFALLFGSAPAQAKVVAQVSVAQQKMVVYVNGKVKHVWNVSTGRKGFATPRGTYAPKHLVRQHYSKKYYNSPMPYSIFFRGGYAVHGTSAVNKLGGPASHGCVRLATGNAARLYSLVQQHGRGSSRIVIS